MGAGKSAEVELFLHFRPWNEGLGAVAADSFVEVSQILQVFYAFTEIRHFGMPTELRSISLDGEFASVLLIRIFPVFHSIHPDHISFQPEQNSIAANAETIGVIASR